MGTCLSQQGACHDTAYVSFYAYVLEDTLHGAVQVVLATLVQKQLPSVSTFQYLDASSG